MKSPALKLGSPRVVRRTRAGAESPGNPSALATRSTKRAPARRKSTSSTKPVRNPIPMRGRIGASTRAARQQAEKKPPLTQAKTSSGAKKRGVSRAR